MPAPERPETRCRHCGLRYQDHGKMADGCFVRGRAVRGQRFEPVDAPRRGAKEAR